MSQDDLRCVELNNDESELEIHSPRDDEFAQVEQTQKVVLTIQFELNLVGQAVTPVSVKVVNSPASRSGLLPCQEIEVKRDNKNSEQGGPCTIIRLCFIDLKVLGIS
jgi:hypothetical protein